MRGNKRKSPVSGTFLLRSEKLPTYFFFLAAFFFGAAFFLAAFFLVAIFLNLMISKNGLTTVKIIINLYNPNFFSTLNEQCEQMTTL